MTSALDGKVAVVTGAAGGIGLAISQSLIARGACVLLADLAGERANSAAQALGSVASSAQVDISDEQSVAEMIAKAVAHFGKLDIVINNAAALSPDFAARDRDVQTMDCELWDRTFAVNTRGTMLVCRESLKAFGQSGGSIVNIVSNLALQGHLIQAAYSASKAAVIQLTRSIAASHGRKGVRCNAVAPGMTMTPALQDAFPAHVRRLVEDETLRERLGEPDDIAEVVAFLASDHARNITGQVIVADGGLSSHVPGISGFRALGSGDAQ